MFVVDMCVLIGVGILDVVGEELCIYGCIVDDIYCVVYDIFVDYVMFDYGVVVFEYDVVVECVYWFVDVE